jgi:hypothetical protein
MIGADRFLAYIAAWILRYAREDIDGYRRRLTTLPNVGFVAWRRYPIRVDERLSDLHSGLIGVAFVVLGLVNVAALLLIPHLGRLVGPVAMFPLIAVCAVCWSNLLFRVVFDQIRIKRTSERWDFTITVSPIVFAVSWILSVALEYFLLFS